MSYEIILNRYTLGDESAANALSVGFGGSRSFDDINKNLERALSLYPLTCSTINIEKGKPYFKKKDKPLINFERVSQSDKVWITKQIAIPFDLKNGEFLRFALAGENNFVIYAHPIISDSRGLVAFAKAVLSKEYVSTEFYFPKVDDIHLNIADKFKLRSLIRSKGINILSDKAPLKLKSVSLKSEIIFRLCSGEKVSLLSFFITTALSLNKTKRKKIAVPYCEKDNFDDILINDSRIFAFNRGFEPRLKFYDNAGEIDKFFESIISKKSYRKNSFLFSKLSDNNLDNPIKSKKVYNYIHSDMCFDVLNTINDDDIIKTLRFYPSSSFIDNNFGICVVDNAITISTVLHNEKGEKLFNDFQSTINLLSKEAARQFKNLK
ncbi:MAG: hypothetical protein JJE21_01620 [Spirochaetaceae bacterium]|nr:hypothetical protein [Spirochaetaceae bacterium]